MWDTQAGDLVIPAVAMVTKKNILIYKTRPTYTACGKFPIDVVMASTLGGEVDTEVPLVLCYTGDHYEGLIPCTEEDVFKTVEIVHEWNSTGKHCTGHPSSKGTAQTRRSQGNGRKMEVLQKYSFTSLLLSRTGKDS